MSKFSVKKPFTIFVAVVIVLVFGGMSFYKMTPDLFPELTAPYALVMTSYPGASAEEVEIQLTEPLEKQLASLSNIENVTSQSSDNYSMVVMEFSDDVNMDAISVDIRDKIDQIENQFPENASKPVVMKMSMDMMPVTVAAVSMKDKNAAQVSKLYDEKIENKLKSVEGVASVEAMGLVDEGIQVVLSQDKIDAVNNNISSKISSEMNKNKKKVKKGINKIKSAQSQISDGEDGLEEGTTQIDTAIYQMNSQISKMETELPILKLSTLPGYQTEVATTSAELEILNADLTLLNEELAALEAADPKDEKAIEDKKAEITLKEGEITDKEAEKTAAEQNVAATTATIAKYEATIPILQEQISELEKERDSAAFIYSDLSSTDAVLGSTLENLKSSLKEIEDAKEAAIDSADMTGVITMENISSILTAQNFEMPAGYVSDGKADVLVSVGDKLKNEEEIQDLILFDIDVDGVDPIRVSDVATVAYVTDDSETYGRINGENAVLVSFTKQSTYATANVADSIADRFEELEEEYKDDGLKFSTLMDQGEYIHRVINSVIENLLLGAILAIIILLFFLRDIRPTLITAISIPVSVIFAVALMYFSGVTLNMISLSGLAIGVGMLVDNSIVVIENIYRLRSMGYTAIQAAVSGAGQVAGAITASTLTTICVFAPIVFVTGMTREIFMDLALTVTYSLVASLLIALTLVPAMAKGMLVKTSKHKTVLGQGGRVIKKYRQIAEWAIHHKVIVLLSALVLLIASSGLLLSKGFEYMADMGSYQVSADVTAPEDSTLEETEAINDEICKEVKKIDGVETVGVMLNSEMMSMYGVSSGGNADLTKTSIYAVLDESKAENSKLVEEKIKEVAEKNNATASISSSSMTSMMSSSGVNMKLYGDDIDDLRSTALKLEEELSKMPELEDVSDVNDESTAELHITVNKNNAMKEGLTVAQVYQQIAAKLSKEKTATTITDDGSTINVNVENSTKDNFTRSDLENMKLTVTKKDGTTEKVRLSKISVIYDDASLSTIMHDNQKRYLEVTASIKDGYNATKVTSKVKNLVNTKDLIPANIDVDYGGEYKEIIDAMKQMILLLSAGLLLVYLVMVAQFQSLRSPFIIIFTIPLAFTGGMLALLICNQVISVVSMMGFVMLMGVVVNNAIVLVDTVNRFRLDGMGMDEAIIQAGAVRMRPVLMTAATTVLGLLPMAIGIGTGSELIQPVAMVCIGGLIYATLTTLVVVPVMYKLIGKKHMEKIADEELEIITA